MNTGLRLPAPLTPGAGSRSNAGLHCQNPAQPVFCAARIMPQIVFAPAIQRHQPCPPLHVAAGTVRDALRQAFSAQPQMRNYVLDDQGRLRRHVAIFIDGCFWHGCAYHYAVPRSNSEYWKPKIERSHVSPRPKSAW